MTQKEKNMVIERGVKSKGISALFPSWHTNGKVSASGECSCTVF